MCRVYILIFSLLCSFSLHVNGLISSQIDKSAEGISDGDKLTFISGDQRGTKAVNRHKRSVWKLVEHYIAMNKANEKLGGRLIKPGMEKTVGAMEKKVGAMAGMKANAEPKRNSFSTHMATSAPVAKSTKKDLVPGIRNLFLKGDLIPAARDDSDADVIFENVPDERLLELNDELTSITDLQKNADLHETTLLASFLKPEPHESVKGLIAMVMREAKLPIDKTNQARNVLKYLIAGYPNPNTRLKAWVVVKRIDEMRKRAKVRELKLLKEILELIPQHELDKMQENADKNKDLRVKPS